MPDDADSLVPEPIDVRGVLEPALASAAEEIMQRDRRLIDIAHAIDAKETVRSGTQSAHERQELEDEIRHLKDDLARMQVDREALVARVQEAVDNAPALLRTEEHRPLLKHALAEARLQVIIISPWMNPETVNDELCGLMRAALGRGVRLHIGYGIGQNRTGPDAERQRRRARGVISKIERYARDVPRELLDIVNVRETHEKILICDKDFGVLTSFNWLSYRGDVDEGYRRETGMLLRNQESVQRLIQRAAEAFTTGTSAEGAGAGTGSTKSDVR